MKKFVCLLIVLGGVIYSSCTSNNPLDGDSENNPEIVGIELDANKFLVIVPGTIYSGANRIVLERKSTGGFEKIPYDELTRTSLRDTSFDRELDHDFDYRIRIENGDYISAYSPEKAYQYVTAQLTAPDNLQLTTLELQGIQLQWRDRSGKEESYSIEKDDGGGYQEIASLSANAGSFFDAIAGMPNPALNLAYRVRAYSSTFTSPWVEVATSHSGLGNPTNLRIRDTSFHSFILEWDDNSTIETGYLVERLKDDGQYEEIAELAANVNQHLEFQEETGSYSYRVRAAKDGIYSAYSNELVYFVTAAVPTEGLVAHWPFSGNAEDAFGSNDGTVSGATLTTGRFGNAQGAYSFDGDDWITVDDSPSFTLNADPFTFAMWIKLAAYGAEDGYYLLSHSEGPGNSVKWFIWIANDGIRFVAHPTPGFTEFSTSVFNLDQWYHVSLVRNGSELKAYLDGILVGTGPLSADIPDPAGIFQIGTESDRPNGVFQGQIDDVRIFKRALAPDEIQALYHEGGWGN